MNASFCLFVYLLVLRAASFFRDLVIVMTAAFAAVAAGIIINIIM